MHYVVIAKVYSLLVRHIYIWQQPARIPAYIPCTAESRFGNYFWALPKRTPSNLRPSHPTPVPGTACHNERTRRIRLVPEGTHRVRLMLDNAQQCGICDYD